MDPLTAALLAMQAAGMVMDWYGTRQQIELGKMGMKVEQAGIESNIALTRVQAEDATLRSMDALRQALGTQAAIMAARGTRSNAGSAIGIQNASISAFNQDKEMRKMNLMAKVAQLKAQGVMSFLHQETYKTQMEQALRKRIFSQMSGSSMMGTGFGGSAPGANATPGGNYGMTPVT